MGKRYFCDYCDRSFQDNLHNRKKHLNGVQHLRAKRAWYDLFRDAAAILQEEQSKKPCRKFLQTGQCDFGSNCRFSHMTEQDLEKLSAQVQVRKTALVQVLELLMKSQGSSRKPRAPVPTVLEHLQ
ncbi:zinc finger matrin-type protein 5 isoform X4 [Gallus gallus]|uniref:Zinc finger matrin-type protein 5 n=1 Tax=Gallus gallus TaxID=9031 RepID=A0A1D5PMH8_CHICK|nr:zinc finger matrin-type protein 5 isoform 1 [Gallus gallus]XP_046757139.1 zinc finger matrin-type protein 5 isoform X4 [Gallus gallus]XP_046784201.1 zinc finger matrin-type protein 5 isoform X4 [Gallus gallus]|eukprot:NP_001264442.1 zinc finger matrin-type protein 5 isoform 1 [Gallus gallus]